MVDEMTDSLTLLSSLSVVRDMYNNLHFENVSLHTIKSSSGHVVHEIDNLWNLGEFVVAKDAYNQDIFLRLDGEVPERCQLCGKKFDTGDQLCGIPCNMRYVNGVMKYEYPPSDTVHDLWCAYFMFKALKKFDDDDFHMLSMCFRDAGLDISNPPPERKIGCYIDTDANTIRGRDIHIIPTKGKLEHVGM